MGAVSIERFGLAPDGSKVDRIVLENGGSRVAVINWGASLQEFLITGCATSIVLGSPEFSAYLGPLKYCGAVVGRVANRIAQGRALLNGQRLDLERNENGRTCLHGGTRGSATRNWTIADCCSRSVALALRLNDGEGGFPGNLDVGATYSLEANGALVLKLTATTDATTFCNLAHHAYWSFAPKDRLQNHYLTVAADAYLPVDTDLIPLGAPVPVATTQFDFREPRAVIKAGATRLDHNFCLRPGPGLRPACRLKYKNMVLDIATDATGLQIYDGAHLDSGGQTTYAGTPYRSYAGLALEPQHWPDAPNHPNYPDIRLNPGEVYAQTSRFHARSVAPGSGDLI